MEAPARTDTQQRVELREALGQIGALPERRRRIFVMHLAGLSYAEITARTGEQPNAICKQIRKARIKLRRLYD
jgi:DNA-directed RNA polymerase specialized sigma24 family protein